MYLSAITKTRRVFFMFIHVLLGKFVLLPTTTAVHVGISVRLYVGCTSTQVSLALMGQEFAKSKNANLIIKISQMYLMCKAWWRMHHGLNSLQ